jgi:hypothetical protein
MGASSASFDHQISIFLCQNIVSKTIDKLIASTLNLLYKPQLAIIIFIDWAELHLRLFSCDIIKWYFKSVL